MSLFEILTGLFTKESAKYAYYAIDREHVSGSNYSDESLQAGKHYFRLWLAEMYLKKERNWFKDWHPVVHSLIRFQFGTQTVEIPHVAGANQLKEVTLNNLEKVISLNYPMTTLMPFNGGVVEVLSALIAMEGKNYVGSVIKVLGDLSGLLVVPQLSTALSIAAPIAAGVQDLLGGKNGELHLGLHQAFTCGDGGAELRPGFIAVLLGDEKDYPKNELWVHENRLRRGKTLQNTNPLTGVTYMLFRIASTTERDDWRGLSNIADAFRESLKYLAEGDSDKAQLGLKRALLLVLSSPDLTRADRARVAKALKEEFDEARSSGLSATQVAKRTFEDVVARRAISPNDALLEGAPTLQGLFAEE
jgi:hypothetical protein